MNTLPDYQKDFTNRLTELQASGQLPTRDAVIMQANANRHLFNEPNLHVKEMPALRGQQIQQERDIVTEQVRSRYLVASGCDPLALIAFRYNWSECTYTARLESLLLQSARSIGRCEFGVGAIADTFNLAQLENAEDFPL